VLLPGYWALAEPVHLRRPNSSTRYRLAARAGSLSFPLSALSFAICPIGS